MTSRTELDDIEIPDALAAAVREAAAAVPPVDHGLDGGHGGGHGHDGHGLDLALAGTRRRARRHRRRRSTGLAALGAAAATAVLVGTVGLVGRRSATPEGEVTIPAAAVGAWSQARQGGVAALLPVAAPDGWTLRQLGTSAAPADTPDVTSQLFAVDGRPPLGHGVVVDSWAGDGSESFADDATAAVRGRPAAVGPSDDATAGPDAVGAAWVEDEVVHQATAVGMTRTELVRYLDSLAARDDPATGFDAPAGGALSELDTVAARDPYFSSAVYEGPGGEVIEVAAHSPGSGRGLVHRLAGRPRDDGLVIVTPDGDPPTVSVARADGWTVDVTAGAGAPSLALLEEIATGAEPFTVQELVDRGLVGPVTDRATVGEWTLEVRGHDGARLLLCLTSGTGEQVCDGVAHSPDTGFASGSIVVDGRWVVATVAEGDEAGQVLAQPDGGSPDDWSPDDAAPADGPALTGDQERTGGHVGQVVAVPDDVDAVLAMSPPSGAGREGVGYFRPAGTGD
jgi:hypothetical protein